MHNQIIYVQYSVVMVDKQWLQHECTDNQINLLVSIKKIQHQINMYYTPTCLDK